MAVQKHTAPPVEGAMFGDLAFYGGGSFTIPEGDYVASNHEVIVFRPEEKQGRATPQPRLGVMITFKSRTDPDAEAKEQFYSMGTAAMQSWAPHPEHGKGVVPVAGGPGAPLPSSTNWGLYLKSLYDSGLDPGVFTNDLSVLDGMWVHIHHMLEPEERKGFAGAKTGEAAAPIRTTPNKIAVVSLIEEDGKPWEGGGGDVVAPAAPVKAAVKVNGKPIVPTKAATKPAAKAPEPPAESDDDALKSAAVSGLGDVLASTPPTMTRLKLRTELFKNLTKIDPDTAKAAIDTFFASDDALNSILGDVGYAVNGSNIQLL